MSRKNLILFLILLLLGGSIYFYQKIILPRREQAKSIINFLAPIKEETVDKIIIAKGEQETVLVKNDDVWQVASANNWPAQTLLLDNFWREFSVAQAGALDLLSKSAEVKKNFKLAESGFKLKLLQGETVLLETVVGRSPSGDNLLAPADSDWTYAIKGELVYALDYEDWRNKTIFKTNDAAFDKITVERGGQIIKLEKAANTWLLADQPQVKINQERAAALVTVLSDLQASSLPDQTAKDTDLAANRFKIIASGIGINNILLLGKEKIVNGQGSGEIYIKREDAPTIYLISKEQYDILAVDLQNLRS